MTGRPLRLDIEVENLDLALDFLQNAPEAVSEVLEETGHEAIGIVGPAVDALTNVDTGFLLSNNSFSVESHFTLMYANFTPYANFVNSRFRFVERGVESVRDELEALYDEAITELTVRAW